MFQQIIKGELMKYVMLLLVTLVTSQTIFAKDMPLTMRGK